MDEMQIEPTISGSVKTESKVENAAIKEVKKITIQNLLCAGSHFGHKTDNWNPKMAPYLYGSRNDIYIFNLDRTLKLWQEAREILVNTAAKGDNILLVGAKKQCKEFLTKEAERCGAFYVSHKWVGGLLTNLGTVRRSIHKMKDIRSFLEKAEEGTVIRVTKKEKLQRKRELLKLEKQFGGIEDMKVLPDLIFIIDVNRHHIAVNEAKTKHIPIIGLVDSNAKIENIDYIIPANDDSIGSLELFITNVADAILEGKELREQNLLGQKDVMTEEEIKKEEIQLQDKQQEEIPSEKRKFNKRKKKRRMPGYPKKKRIGKGVTFYTQDQFEKENN